MKDGSSYAVSPLVEVNDKGDAAKVGAGPRLRPPDNSLGPVVVWKYRQRSPTAQSSLNRLLIGVA